MRVYDHTSHSYHYYDAANESGRRIGGAAVEHNDFMHCAYVEHCKTDKDHCAKIVFVQTNKSERLKGVATSLLNKITADYEDWDLFLNVRPLDTDQERFVEGAIDSTRSSASNDVKGLAQCQLWLNQQKFNNK